MDWRAFASAALGKEQEKLGGGLKTDTVTSDGDFANRRHVESGGAGRGVSAAHKLWEGTSSLGSDTTGLKP